MKRKNILCRIRLTTYALENVFAYLFDIVLLYERRIEKKCALLDTNHARLVPVIDEDDSGDEGGLAIAIDISK